MACARFTGNPARFDDLIACLPELAARLDGLAQWWWLRRYCDMIHPEVPQHVAVYLRLAGPDDFGRAAAEAAAFAPGPAAGYEALVRCLDQGSGPPDRSCRDLACGLADPAGGLAALRALPGGDTVAEAWDRRDVALAGYHEQLSAQRDPGTVPRTLLHEHHMRVIGLDPVIEKQTGRLARAAALRHLALAGRP